MLFLVERQQGLAAQVGIANGARKIAELGVSDENVAFVTGLCLKRLGAVGTVNVTQLKGKCGMRKLCLLLLVSIFMTYMEGVVTFAAAEAYVLLLHHHGILLDLLQVLKHVGFAQMIPTVIATEL